MKIDDIKKSKEKGEYAGKLVDNEVENSKELPTKFGMWSKVKSFLFQEINIGKKPIFEVSPKEEKILTDVHDFLFQEISFSGLFSLGKNKKSKNQDEQL